MAVSMDEAKTIVAEFCREYPATEAVTFVVKETQEAIYGPQASRDKVGTILGGYVPGTVDRTGRVSGGRCDLPVASFHQPEDLRRSLRHELLGHFALNTLRPDEKRAVLTALVATRHQEGIAPFWRQVDKNYTDLFADYLANDAELRKAEEVYALACERITPQNRAVLASGQRAFRETCIEASRPMRAADLANITLMVADGLRDRTRTQQTFPRDPRAQFSLDKEPIIASQDRDTEALRARLRGEPSVTPEDTRSELLEDEQTAKMRDRLRNPRMSPEDTHAELLDETDRRNIDVDGNVVEASLREQLNEDQRQRDAREQDLASHGLNTVQVSRSSRELDRGDFIMPRRITQAYTEINGKFYAKESNRVMFEDKGEKLTTSTTDKTAIADMIVYAKAKQWESFKLTGSRDFRREAWLQAESQGIKTQGYIPKQSDLAALETLRQQRATNAITPLQERHKEPEAPTAMAPRHDINKNQAVMHAEASKAITTNLQALRERPALAERPMDELTKLAYWRGIVQEDNKLQPLPVQEEALARFDKQAEDPQFLKRLDQETGAKIQEKTMERAQKRETPELSL